MKHCKCTTVIISLLLLAIAAPSFAQDSWLPSFREGTSVYLAPTLAEEEVTLFNASGYAEELKDLGSVHDLQIYVVVTRNADSKLSEENKGPALVRRLWETWNNNASFSESRALVILMTAPKDGPLLTIGVRAGSYLNSLGINRNTMNDPTGPVFTAKNQYLNTSPARVPLAIAEQINALVTAQAKPEHQTQPQISQSINKEGEQTMNLIAIIGICAFFALGLIFLAVSSSRNSRRSSSTRSEFENRLNA